MADFDSIQDILDGDIPSVPLRAEKKQRKRRRSDVAQPKMSPQATKVLQSLGINEDGKLIHAPPASSMLVEGGLPSQLVIARQMKRPLLVPEPKWQPKTVLGVDVGERRVGFTIMCSFSPDASPVIMLDDTVNLVTVTPSSVDYLHQVYDTSPLPDQYQKWSEYHTLEECMHEDETLAEELALRAQEYVPKKKTAAEVEAGGVKRSNNKWALKHFLIELCFDTTVDDNYEKGGIMNSASFVRIKGMRPEQISDHLKREMTTYAAYFRSAFGLIDEIHVEDQALQFGAQGKIDQIAITDALKTVFPEDTTKYRITSAAMKMKLHALREMDVNQLRASGCWKTGYFWPIGSSGRLVYNHKKVPKVKRGPLYRFDEEKVKKTASVDEKSESTPPATGASFSVRRSLKTAAALAPIPGRPTVVVNHFTAAPSKSKLMTTRVAKNTSVPIREDVIQEVEIPVNPKPQDPIEDEDDDGDDDIMMPLFPKRPLLKPDEDEISSSPLFVSPRLNEGTAFGAEVETAVPLPIQSSVIRPPASLLPPRKTTTRVESPNYDFPDVVFTRHVPSPQNDIRKILDKYRAGKPI